MPVTNGDAPEIAVEDREARRRQLLWSGVLQTARGPVQCIVIDISEGGARLSAGAVVNVGQSVTLMVQGMGMYRGSVVWTEAGTIGVKFAAASATAAA
ncbi:MAG TPA: PilZ domain-containing protein [Stellaceae bacterium]|nr:PilZ domain-containing protein [Stellaceae bacterium]